MNVFLLDVKKNKCVYIMYKMCVCVYIDIFFFVFGTRFLNPEQWRSFRHLLSL